MDTIQKSKNIKLIAYLRFKGIHPDKVEKIGPRKAIYHFNMSKEDWAQTRLDFDKSEFYTYSQCLDAIIELAH